MEHKSLGWLAIVVVLFVVIGNVITLWRSSDQTVISTDPLPSYLKDALYFTLVSVTGASVAAAVLVYKKSDGKAIKYYGHRAMAMGVDGLNSVVETAGNVRARAKQTYAKAPSFRSAAWNRAPVLRPVLKALRSPDTRITVEFYDEDNKILSDEQGTDEKLKREHDGIVVDIKTMVSDEHDDSKQLIAGVGKLQFSLMERRERLWNLRVRRVEILWKHHETVAIDMDLYKQQSDDGDPDDNSTVYVVFTGTNTSVTADVDHQRRELKSLRNQAKDAEKARDEATSKLAEAEKTTKETRGELADKEREIETLTGKLEEVKARFSNSQEDIDRLSEIHRQTEDVKKDLERHLEDRERQIGILRNHAEHLRSQSDTRAQRIGELNIHLKTREKTIEKLNNQIVLLDSERDSRSKQIEELNEQAQAQLRHIRSLFGNFPKSTGGRDIETEIATLEQQINDTRAQTEEVFKQLAQHKTGCAGLVFKLKRTFEILTDTSTVLLNKSTEKRRTDVERMENVVRGVENQVTELQRTNEDLQAELDKVKATHEAQVTQYQEVIGEHEALVAQMNKTIAEKKVRGNKYKKRSNEYWRYVKELEAQIAHLTHDKEVGDSLRKDYAQSHDELEAEHIRMLEKYEEATKALKKQKEMSITVTKALQDQHESEIEQLRGEHQDALKRLTEEYNSKQRELEQPINVEDHTSQIAQLQENYKMELEQLRREHEATVTSMNQQYEKQLQQKYDELKANNEALREELGGRVRTVEAENEQLTAQLDKLRNAKNVTAQHEQIRELRAQLEAGEDKIRHLHAEIQALNVQNAALLGEEELDNQQETHVDRSAEFHWDDEITQIP